MADKTRTASRGPLEWITGLSTQDARLIVAAAAVVAAGRVAWDLVVHDWFFPPSPSAAAVAAVDTRGHALAERHRGSMMHLPSAGKEASETAAPDADQLERAFASACAAAKSLGDSVADADMLRLYALFKQAGNGDAPADSAAAGGGWAAGAASLMDPVGAAKRAAWGGVRGMKQPEAKARYCVEVLVIAGLARRASGDQGPVALWAGPSGGSPSSPPASGGRAAAGAVAPALAAAFVDAVACKLLETPDDAPATAPPMPEMGGGTSASGSGVKPLRGVDVDLATAPTDGPLSAAAAALEEAVRTGDVDTVLMILGKAGAQAGGLARTALDSDGTTLLHMAAEAGEPESVRALVKAGASVAAADVDGATPLHCACAAGDAVTAGVLVAHGADVTAVSSGETPIQLLPSTDDVEAFRAAMGEARAAEAARMQ
ncbi:hypothetical protein FNF31_04183 [Cafeteria roenbergensis]|uniref:ACB domain-containing protein n=1 Tax=Cafeteria roenbergensis TaxID=33653 RepID=A0A5A8D4H4_CAFRO|nr:hypothetical protein FNF28_05462 [Cafeteria roenbergensis]KAA0160632.1 hypothetical protein FNF31_04183 [Cafeteria roenbergensis]